MSASSACVEAERTGSERNRERWTPAVRQNPAQPRSGLVFIIRLYEIFSSRKNRMNPCSKLLEAV